MEAVWTSLSYQPLLLALQVPVILVKTLPSVRNRSSTGLVMRAASYTCVLIP
ncbi:uncharacterized protein P174DRAFT_436608 [Aspergillus novofumigatus IBT 16806]|uniref:Uncharacterized protein n=1 Tax=Aspergillus novofumigatus (strain IBT 16806) TaxID=1392255 RepID=A0A2I1CKS2_ASPN1|nr:uncharacterized protein P174DRAFT_436608 [Aspergillus novofumigatus IBT 16806]PKX98218.1 hypothetical protein P174DRAFT_436608 [Aspergillus novofumigatus IBT 16806]